MWEIKARKIQTIKSNQVKSKVLPFLVLSSVAWNRQRAQSPRVCLASEEVLSETLPCSIPWAMGNSRTGYLRKNLSSAVIGKKKKKKKKKKGKIDVLAWVAMTKWVSLKQGKSVVSQFGRLENPRSKFQQGLVPGKGSFPGLQMATFSLCPDVAERENSPVSFSF